jgi:hypothetical protein
MRLPEDPKEKLKILVLVAIGAVAVLYTLVTVVVKPFMTRKAENTESIAKLQEQLTDAQRDLNRMWLDRDRNTKVLRSLVELSNDKDYLLHPRLGNYELGAREYVEAAARRVGVELEAVREIGLIQLPQDPAIKEPRSLKTYNLRISVQTGLQHLIALLGAIENGNPYLCVSGVSIDTQPANPARHQISFELQWPVWTDPLMAQDLERRLREAEATEPVARPPQPDAEHDT